MSLDGDPFRLVRWEDVRPGARTHDSDAAHKRLDQRTLPEALQGFYKRLHDFEAAAPRFQLDEKLETAINMALAVGAPLLLTGEPGTGKTQVAYFLKWYFGTELYQYQVRSTSTAESMKYDFDAVAYLQAAYRQDREKPLDRSDPEFLHKRALWHAYESKTIPVLLIDEIDKAPRDFPNDLLQELDKHWFEHPFKPEAPIRSSKPPIVVITSNEERRLPDAFLRRCIYHNIALDEDLVRRAVDSHFTQLEDDIRDAALDRFWVVRDRVVGKKPSTAELLVWLAILGVRGVRSEELTADRPLAKLPAVTALIKEKTDLDRLAERL